MKKVLKALPILVAALALTFCAAACSPATLEDYYRETSKIDELQTLAENNSTDEMTATCSIEGNTVICEYQFNVGIDSSQASMLNELLESETYQQTFYDLVNQLRDEYRLRSITAKVVYKNISGNILAEKEYNPD